VRVRPARSRFVRVGHGWMCRAIRRWQSFDRHRAVRVAGLSRPSSSSLGPRCGCSASPSARSRPRSPPAPPLRGHERRPGHVRSCQGDAAERRGAFRSVVPCASGGDRRPRYEHRGHLGGAAACGSTLRCVPRPALVQAVCLAARPTTPGQRCSRPTFAFSRLRTRNRIPLITRRGCAGEPLFHGQPTRFGGPHTPCAAEPLTPPSPPRVSASSARAVDPSFEVA